ncbi:OsmC family protein [Marivita sp. XM-24bin2]|uniref:OsmC family protein n=1 Tax=unclassified Marivita TaxID=2632480 RepID=UPI000D78DDE0|nr:OsmC family protein [Marivita sp. XM-24bin2]MCR9110407.1 OsmC family protein [Paracoccaceae bacterium]PWL34892.1 MAG: OsmC family peroxiredoxin [Marivita sp. XM-24bin2]
MITKTATAHWSGGLKDGKGTISTESGALNTQPYGFNTRFEDKPGTNPEELIGAAHAGCFSMAFSMILGEYDVVAEDINTKASVGLEEKDGGFAITTIHLDMTAKIPGISEEDFQKAAQTAKENCPLSKVLAAAEITMDAKLTQ